jgi:hypothetical protein
VIYQIGSNRLSNNYGSENAGLTGDHFVQDNIPAMPTLDASPPSRSFEKWMMSEVGGVPVALMVCAAAALVLGFALALSSSGRW